MASCVRPQPAPTAPALPELTARCGRPRRTPAACTAATTTPSSPWSTTAPTLRRPCAAEQGRWSSAWPTTPAAAHRESAVRRQVWNVQTEEVGVELENPMLKMWFVALQFVTRACVTCSLLSVSMGRSWFRTTGRTPAVRTTSVVSFSFSDFLFSLNIRWYFFSRNNVFKLFDVILC